MLERPHLSIPVDDFKKRDSEEIQKFREMFKLYAVQEGVWDKICQTLDAQAQFTNMTRHDVKMHNTVISDIDFGSPSQGLVVTGYEEPYEPGVKIVSLNDSSPEVVQRSLDSLLYHFVLFNHPEFLDNAYAQAQRKFRAPDSAQNKILESAEENIDSLTIHDLTLTVGNATQNRLSRTKVFAHGLMVGYKHASQFSAGREQARNVFVIGENPDVTGSSMMLASLAATHFLAGIPRDGFFKDIHRQGELAAEALSLLPELAKLVGRTDEEVKILTEWYQHNLIGVLEAEPDAALRRAKVLYEQGIRTLRVYSPEPNKNLVSTVMALRKFALSQDWEPVEIFAGQVVSVEQAVELEQAGTDAIYLGVGGGGRCITGVVANLAIDWPQLLWKLRGKLNIPVIVQGGANDNPATTLALGASGIGVVGKLAGTIESPGGLLYFQDSQSTTPFKYYGGEASNRARAIGDRRDTLGRTINTEGETTRKYLMADLDKGITASSSQMLASIMEGLVTGLVFQGDRNVEEMHDAHPNIRRESAWGNSIRGSH